MATPYETGQEVGRYHLQCHEEREGMSPMEASAFEGRSTLKELQSARENANQATTGKQKAFWADHIEFLHGWLSVLD